MVSQNVAVFHFARIRDFASLGPPLFLFLLRVNGCFYLPVKLLRFLDVCYLNGRTVRESLRMCDAKIRVPVHSTAGGRDSSEAGTKSMDFSVFMDSQLQPIPPDTTSEESMKIFEEHKEMAREYLEVQTEMAYLNSYLKELEEKLSGAEQQRQQIQQLSSEKESLEQLQQNLTRQLELLQRQRQGGWMFVPDQGSRLT